MKRTFAVSLLALASLGAAPLVAQAGCSPADFKVEDFQVMVGTGGARPTMQMPGKLVNNCGEAAAAQISIEAKGDDGHVIQAKKGWPAGTANIAPGSSTEFDMGRMFRYQPSMKSYSVKIVAVRTW